MPGEAVRMWVGVSSHAHADHIVKVWFGGVKSRLVPAQEPGNKVKYWVVQPGKFASDKKINVFFDQFQRECTVTVGSGATKKTITTTVAHAKAHQYQ